MTRNEIEHMWKVASDNPNHDTNWHDPVVEAFAKLVAKHTLLNIDPSSFMSYQEGVEVGRLAEREACAKVCEEHAKAYAKLEKNPATSRAWAACIDIHDSISERGGEHD